MKSKNDLGGGAESTTSMRLPRVLRTPEAAKYLGLAVSTLEIRRLTGGGPKFVRIGVRAVGYLIDDLDDWIRSRARLSTSDWKDRPKCTSRAPRHEEAGEGV
jgi:predicted DNA-binding transcriptional regulator AlpA